MARRGWDGTEWKNKMKEIEIKLAGWKPEMGICAKGVILGRSFSSRYDEEDEEEESDRSHPASASMVG